MTRENAVRKLMEVAKEKFNAGKGIMINDIPFYNFGGKLEMRVNENTHGGVHSVAIMLGESTISYIMGDLIKEINVDFHNILLEDLGKVYGYIGNDYFECQKGGE